MSRWAEIASLVCAAAATIFLLFTPAYSSQSGTMTSNGTSTVARHQQTLLEANEPAAVVVLLPVVVAGAPLFTRGRANRTVRFASAIVLVGFSVLGLASIGLFFIPSAAAMVLAAVVPSSGGARGQPARDQ